MSTNEVYLSVDVAKAKIHLASSLKLVMEVKDDVDRHQEIVRLVQQLNVDHVVLEACDGFEILTCQALQNAGVNTTFANASRVRLFVKSIRVLAVTEKIGATVIAKFAEATQPKATLPTPENAREISALCVRRQQVVEDRVRKNNRLEACADSEISSSLHESIRHLLEEEEHVDMQIETLLEDDAAFQRKEGIMRELKSVGTKTINTLLAHLPELRRLTRQQIAA